VASLEPWLEQRRPELAAIIGDDCNDDEQFDDGEALWDRAMRRLRNYPGRVHGFTLRVRMKLLAPPLYSVNITYAFFNGADTCAMLPLLLVARIHAASHLVVESSKRPLLFFV